MSPPETADVAHRLRSALDDPRWKFRTIEGIAGQVGLEPEQVEELLDAHPELVRKSPLTSEEGRELFTDRDRRPSALERLERLRALLAH